jgi:hypothetical protein
MYNIPMMKRNEYIKSILKLVMIGLLRRPPRNHPGGSTNSFRFGGGFSTSGDYERELEMPFYHW